MPAGVSRWVPGPSHSAAGNATLLDQWSRPAPKITKPKENVIIRLCDIECNFGAPLTDKTNAPFQKDMNAWAAISNRTYIW